MPAAVYYRLPGGTGWRSPGRPDVTPGAPAQPAPVVPGARPSRASTGWVSAGSPTLTTYSAATVPSGTTLTNRYFPGDVTIPTGASNVTLIGCVAEGSIKVRAASNVVVRQCDAQGFIFNGTATGELDRGYTTGAIGVDGIQVKADDTPVPTSIWVHHSYIGNAKVNASSHYDGIQVRGVSGLIIEDNYFDNPGTGIPSNLYDRQQAAIFLEEANGGNHGVIIRRNWLRAMGHGTVSLDARGTLVVEDNVLYPSLMGGALLKSLSGTLVQARNTWGDGSPIADLRSA